MNPKPQSVEEYFSWFSGEILEKLQSIRDTLRREIPEAKEVISYHMPAFRTTEVLVYYAVAKNHIGFYPTNSGVSEFKKELAPYQTSKGAIQFPHDRPIPLDLIAEIAKFRLLEAKERAVKKKKKA
ncbi:DUF1801 domain-containing protein [Algoriphagus sp. H41]|uniref:DUF1801 domain-containing protein n=2 Tax=Algoriphagus oliviformis TaxID=2811231 RepID=A0ABS3C5Y2_9BACT|nr:DUF1801 domain-containing protein [Algoriphagus oliviformis]